MYPRLSELTRGILTVHSFSWDFQDCKIALWEVTPNLLLKFIFTTLKKRSILSKKYIFRCNLKLIIFPCRTSKKRVLCWSFEDFAIFLAVFTILAIFRVFTFLTPFLSSKNAFWQHVLCLGIVSYNYLNKSSEKPGVVKLRYSLPLWAELNL